MFISFGSINIKWFLFLLFPLLSFLSNLMDDKLECDKNLFFSAFLKFSGRSLSFIFWIILSKSLSFDKKEEKENNSTLNINGSIYKYKDLKQQKNTIFVELILDDIEKNEKSISHKHKTSTILLICTILLEFIGTNLKFLVNNNKYNNNISGGLTILSSCERLLIFALLSKYCISNNKIHRHQYISGIVILIVSIALFILSYILENKEYNENFLIKLLLLLIPQIFYCIKDICGVFYLIRSQGNVYKLIFFNGIIGLILLGILQLILSFSNCNDIKDFLQIKNDICDGDIVKTIIYNFKSFEAFGSYISFLLIFFNLAKTLCTWLLIYNFSLNHYAAIYTVPVLFKFIMSSSDLKVFYIIGIIIIILMTLIYNEIIILKFCGLDKETKVEISKRSDLDSSIELCNGRDSNITDNSEDDE